MLQGAGQPRVHNLLQLLSVPSALFCLLSLLSPVLLPLFEVPLIIYLSLVRARRCDQHTLTAHWCTLVGPDFILPPPPLQQCLLSIYCVSAPCGQPWASWRDSTLCSIHSLWKPFEPSGKLSDLPEATPHSCPVKGARGSRSDSRGSLSALDCQGSWRRGRAKPERLSTDKRQWPPVLSLERAGRGPPRAWQRTGRLAPRG